MFGDFLELYLESNPMVKNIMAHTMRKLMEITDISTFNQMYFFYNCDEN